MSPLWCIFDECLWIYLSVFWFLYALICISVSLEEEWKIEISDNKKTTLVVPFSERQRVEIFFGRDYSGPLYMIHL